MDGVFELQQLLHAQAGMQALQMWVPPLDVWGYSFEYNGKPAMEVSGVAQGSVTVHARGTLCTAGDFTRNG